MPNVFKLGAFAALVPALVAGMATASTATAATLEDVKARGKLICGISEGLAGFSAVDANGTWAGFDVDFCRAVAAAVLGDAAQVQYLPLSASRRFEVLRAGEIDLLARNSTWTIGREAELELTFVGVTYYDGQGVMLPRARNVLSALELAGNKVCVQGGTTTEANLGDFFRANNMAYEAIVTASPVESLTAYKEGRCAVMTSDISQLYSERLKLSDADEHLILPDTISKEPLGPVVRQADPKWATLVKWVYFGSNGEARGLGKPSPWSARSPTMSAST